MKRIVVSTAVLALACAGLSTAQAAPAVYKVTGGGQFLGSDQNTGAGSTVAFTAQSDGGPESATGENAKGQIQLQLRNAETGAKETFHAAVTCVAVAQVEEGMPGMATIGGLTKDGLPIRIDVLDDGQGGDAMDMVAVRTGRSAQDGGDGGGDQPQDTQLCDMETEEADMLLGRGNVKIHKTKGEQAPAEGETQGKKPAFSLR